MTILIHENMMRGHTRAGWLDSFHSFSFGTFRDPARMGFGGLRVINENRIIPGSGFGWHDHADMDILTLVLSGRLRHEDSLGTVAEIRPGEIQLMRAGTGIFHSERNATDTAPAHFLQIWLIPNQRGGQPAYQQIALPLAVGRPHLLASGLQSGAPLQLGSNARVSILRAAKGAIDQNAVNPGRQQFVQKVEGIATMEGERLVAGDGLQTTDAILPDLIWQTDGMALHFDLA